jgi:penicillin-binding protein 1C
MAPLPVCSKSGLRATERCEADTLWLAKTCAKANACPYHQILHLDLSGLWQVSSDCESPVNMQHRSWFVLPPIQEFYFKGKNPSYMSPPPFRDDCKGSISAHGNSPMQLIYPKQATRIYVPVDLDGKLSSTVFQVAHRSKSAEIFWHLDGQFLGSTTVFHQMALQPPVGKHLLALVDRDGHRLEQSFEIVGKSAKSKNPY